MQFILQVLTLYAIPIIFALTIPEAAQAFVADRFGDRSARAAGRLTLNPAAHIDPLGTIILPLGMIILAKASGGALPAVMIGWAKPIPIDLRQLRDPKRNLRWLAAALPLTNLILAAGWILLFKLALLHPGSYFAAPLKRMAQFGVFINAIFAVFMMLPILPFPGGRILFSLLPPRLAVRYAAHERYGTWIAIALLVTGILGFIILPISKLVVGALAFLFGI